MRKKLIVAFCCLAVAFASSALTAAAVFLSIGWTDADACVYPGGTVLRNAAGDVMRVSLGEGDADCRPYYTADPDDWIVKALVASEDGTYWSHCGIRPLSVIRAAFQNIVWRRRISGASTITMQTVRLIKPHPKTLWWKVKEAVMAMKMERAKSKVWILSQYLNRAPYGSNFVGIEAAANGWFGKGAKELGLGEAAMLAGMVQAPSRFRPDRGMAKALARRDYVLDRMVKLGFATADQAEGARAVLPTVCRAPRPFSHPFFCDWAMREAEGARGARRNGGDFATALDEDVQSLCESAVQDAGDAGGYSVAAAVMRVETGEVVAIACSGSYFSGADGQVNTAASPRPAGSTLKPFLVAHALDRGLATPEERLADTPVSYRGYRPANFDARHRGLVTVRDSLVLSLNIPFVRLLSKVGVEEFGETLAALGLGRAGGNGAEPGLGLAIGNAEVTLIELVAAYSTIARGGTYLPPTAMDIWRRDDGRRPSAGTRVFSEGACYLVSDMLSGDERSGAALGHVADVASSRFAWKTGTSAAFRDAWTVAWNPQYTVGVWCGHKSGGFGDKSVVGAKAAAPVAWRIARSLYPGNDGPWFAKPADVVHRRICSLTGLPANDDCPATEEGRALAGRSSAKLCAVHCRDIDGNAVERRSANVAVASPEDGASFRLAEGAERLTVVFRATAPNSCTRLWWFADGRFACCSPPGGKTPLELEKGEHVVVCSTDNGETGSVRITVQ